ncbi:MAG: iron-siderophore ABC transporter substrate-binding protein [Goleter apudmare HA4340-LM2]|nr:iron-siderophore ABC transporter substrate-binding protein [Goleter apudmare HA4340-LM2]
MSNHVERLITLNTASLGNAIALGVTPIGSTFDYYQPYPDYLKDKLKIVENMGDSVQPNVERITLFEPDLITGWQMHHASIYSQLSNLAPTVLYDWKGNPSSQHYWKEYFNFMAKVLMKEEAAERVWNQYNQRIEQLKIALGDRYSNKTISVVIFCCGAMHLSRENSFSGSILSDLGLQRPESQKIDSPNIPVSEERLDSVDGDVMFVMAYKVRDTGEHDFNRIQQKPLWQKLNAVQQNHVYYVDSSKWRGKNPFAAAAVIDDLYKYLVDTP